MREAGTPQGGYSLTVDRRQGLLALRAWGFWDEALAGQFAAAMREAFADLDGQPWDILTDGSSFLPQRPEVGRCIGELMALAPSMGMRRAANVVNRSLDEIQLKLLAAQNKMANIAFFRTLADARGWLGVGEPGA